MAASICSYCDCADMARQSSAGNTYCRECEAHVSRIDVLRRGGEGFLRIVEIDRRYLRQRRAAGGFGPTPPRASAGTGRG